MRKPSSLPNCAALLLLAGAPALAATSSTALAATAPAPAPIWTLGDENASLTAGGLPDRYYVNQFALGWISAPQAGTSASARLGRMLLGGGQARVSLGVVQRIYTGAETRLDTPPPGDEPFAGYLALRAGLVADRGNTRSLAGLAAGVIGPDAGGGLVQNTFHDVIGQAHTHGWGHQLPDEPAFDLGVARIWRWRIGRIPASTLSADALPFAAGQAGTTLDEVEGGVMLRLGEGLHSDFGAPRLPPAIGGGEAYAPDRPLAWYVFASLTGRLIVHDVFLDGANFSASAHVRKVPEVAEAAVGVAVLWHGMRFAASEVFQTQRFHGQDGGIHQFGAFSISARF